MGVVELIYGSEGCGELRGNEGRACMVPRHSQGRLALLGYLWLQFTNLQSQPVPSLNLNSGNDRTDVSRLTQGSHSKSLSWTPKNNECILPMRANHLPNSTPRTARGLHLPLQRMPAPIRQRLRQQCHISALLIASVNSTSVIMLHAQHGFRKYP
jgi:hypothetical protein